MKILLLEDVGSVSYPMTKELNKAGHTVSHARNVHEARALYGQGISGFDCIIADLNVPADGLTVTEYAKTSGGKLAGWVWLEEDGIVRKRGEQPAEEARRPKIEKLPAVIVYSAYLSAWREKHSQDYPDVIFVSKSSGGVAEVMGRVTAVDSELR